MRKHSDSVWNLYNKHVVKDLKLYVNRKQTLSDQALVSRAISRCVGRYDRIQYATSCNFCRLQTT